MPQPCEEGSIVWWEQIRHKQLLVASLIAGAVAIGDKGKTAPLSLVKWAQEIAETIIKEVK